MKAGEKSTQQVYVKWMGGYTRTHAVFVSEVRSPNRHCFNPRTILGEGHGFWHNLFSTGDPAEVPNDAISLGKGLPTWC